MSKASTITISGFGTYEVDDPNALSGTDSTLTTPNAAADAAAVGAALAGKAPATGVAYIDENDNETVIITQTVDLNTLAALVGGDV